mmetsp:Transcript_41708/g.75456  ORF Transcript_41708/g.75456 Transcript_41708/m.75456 type:complete len:94 (-) Transcript_41708:1392-1673(-)
MFSRNPGSQLGGGISYQTLGVYGASGNVHRSNIMTAVARFLIHQLSSLLAVLDEPFHVFFLHRSLLLPAAFDSKANDYAYQNTTSCGSSQPRA